MVHLNQAVTNELSWRFLLQNEAVWAQILMAKYVLNSSGNASNASHVWRSVLKGVSRVVSRGCRWIRGDGKSIRFWVDPWLENRPLRDDVLGDLDEPSLSAAARSFWTDAGHWDWNNLGRILPPSTLIKLVAIPISDDPEVADILSWQPTTNGEFSIAHAYRIVVGENDVQGTDSLIFKGIW
ncbi:hypothetical protein V2J09_001095 [Rumex salicifolius]